MTTGAGAGHVMLPGTGDEEIGGNGAGGDLRIKDADGHVRIELDAGGPDGLQSTDTSSSIITTPTRFKVHGGEGYLFLGGADTDGALTLRRTNGTTGMAFRLNPQQARAEVGGAGVDGVVALRRDDGAQVLSLESSSGAITGLWAGGADREGWVVLRDQDSNERVWLNGGAGQIKLFGPKTKGLVVKGKDAEERVRIEGDGANVWLGGNGQDGDLMLFHGDAAPSTHKTASVHLEGGNGSLTLRNTEGKTRIHLEGGNGSLTLSDAEGETRIALSGGGGSGRFGGNGANGNVLLFQELDTVRSSDTATVWIQGGSGDIVLRNADCAEEFEVRVDADVAPGSVLVLGDDGALQVCAAAYDSRVAGVVSGAGGVRPGIVLGRVPGATNRLPVALSGKVVVNVDASFGPIRVGSLLTTSPRPGHAMLASDRDRAFGAVIGKAMAPLESGIGSVPMLVGLQ